MNKLKITLGLDHDLAMAESLGRDPEFAALYLKTALEESDTETGEAVLKNVLRQLAMAQAGGLKAIAEQSGLNRQSLHRALSPNGNPTLKTLLALLRTLNIRLSVATPNDQAIHV